MYITPYDILVYLHTLLFVYWLGGDLGVYLSAKYVANRDLSLEERFRFLHVLMQCDMGPRTALIGLIPLGFQMAWMRGYSPIDGASLLLIWIICISWLIANWWLFFNEEHSSAILIKKIDMLLRYLIILGMGSLGLWSLFTGDIIENSNVAAKIFLFAFTVSLGVYLRSEIKNWIIGFSMIRDGGEKKDKGNDIIEDALSRSKVAALSLWGIVALIAFLGKVQPLP